MENVKNMLSSLDWKEYLLYYLIIVNIFSFFLFTIDRIRHNLTGKTIKPLWLYGFVTIFGGALGVNIYFLLFYRKFRRVKSIEKNINDEAKDYYSYWRILALVALIFQAIICGYIFFPEVDVTYILKIYAERKTIIIGVAVWLIIINLITIIVFIYDKERAVEKKHRVREFSLLLLAFMGGSLGALFAMSLVRHKTMKQSFAVGIRLMLVMHVVVLGVFIYNLFRPL